jgi:membrane protease YdiL (CAAX protease family)
MKMDDHTTLPASKMQQALQLPLTRLIIGFLIIVIPVALGQSIIISLSTGWLRGILAMVYTLPVAYGAYYVLVHFIERREMTELAPSGAARETVQGIVIGTLISGGIMAILALAGTYKVSGTNSLSVLLAPLFFAASSAVFEEILFRGVLFRMVERSLGSWLALAISAAIFGGLHLLNRNATVIGALAIMLQAGITLGGAFMLTRRLWLPIGIHFAWNFTQSGIFASAVSGNEAAQGILRSTLAGPEWLTGGTFGPEASIVTVVLGLAVGILFIWRASKRGSIVKPAGKAGGKAAPEGTLR